MCAQGQNKKAAVQSLRCQLDKYNVSPIKNSLPFFNSAEALLTAAWQGGCRSGHGLCDQHHHNRGPCFPILLKPNHGPSFLHVNKTFIRQHFSNRKSDHRCLWFSSFFPGENKEFYSFSFLFKKTLFGPFFGSILMLIMLTQLCAMWLYNAYEP